MAKKVSLLLKEIFCIVLFLYGTYAFAQNNTTNLPQDNTIYGSLVENNSSAVKKHSELQQVFTMQKMEELGVVKIRFCRICYFAVKISINIENFRAQLYKSNEEKQL